MNLMRGLRANDVGQLDVLHAQVLLHDVGGLLLFVDFAAVGHGGHMEEVQCAVRGVVPMPQLLLVIGDA